MFSIQIHLPNEAQVSLKTDSSKLYHALQLKYVDCCQIPSCAPNTVDCTISEDIKSNMFQVVRDGQTTMTPFPLQDISDLLSQTLSLDSSVFTLHGSAIEYQDKAHLFLAATGSGKTTLVTYLTENGFHYIAEDCVFLNRNTLHTIPYLLPIQMREGGMDIIRKLGLTPQIEATPDESMLERYVVKPRPCCRSSVPIRRIYFIQRSESENKVETLATADKINLLMHAPRHAYPLNREYIQFIMRLANTECCRLYYKDMSFVSDYIKNSDKE